MKNIDRLAQHITKYGTKDILVHALVGTKNWILCQKQEPDKWLITLLNPMGNVTYNLGLISDNQHIELWKEITRMEIEHKTSQILLAKELKNKVYNLTKKYENTYKNIKNIKEEETCWAQIKEDWCKKKVFKEGYCKKHFKEFCKKTTNKKGCKSCKKRI